jgi:small subunit ribosomal protein S6
VLRYLTIRVEAHEEGPSAMMRKSDRDRDERGGRGERRPRRDEGGEDIEVSETSVVEE